jgi:hypothetical protein
MGQRRGTSVAEAGSADNRGGRHCREATPQEARLIEAIDHGFREMYLTLISIIQGVAFGFLAERMFNAHGATAEQKIAFAICFMMIVTVWHEYMVGSTIFTWTPTLLDSVIPFAIGMTEFQLIAGAQATTRSFLARLGVFLSVGTAAYANWLFHARHGTANKATYEILKWYIRFGSFYCAAVTVGTLCTAVVLSAKSGSAGVALLTATLVGVSPLFLHSIVNWNRHLQLIRDRVRRAEAARAAQMATSTEQPQ